VLPPAKSHDSEIDRNRKKKKKSIVHRNRHSSVTCRMRSVGGDTVKCNGVDVPAAGEPRVLPIANLTAAVLVQTADGVTALRAGGAAVHFPGAPRRQTNQKPWTRLGLGRWHVVEASRLARAALPLRQQRLGWVTSWDAGLMLV